MLKLIMNIFYHKKIYTTEYKLFDKLYKWHCGLYTILALRRIIGSIISGAIGIVWLIFIKPRIYGLLFVDLFLLLNALDARELRKSMKFSELGMETPSQIRTFKMECCIKKFITTNGRALGKKEWKTIKEYDISLYNDLLSYKCHHKCYYYSLEIAKVIKDSILIWGAIDEPFEEGHNLNAHAIILRNRYIYDSNMRQSIKYEDFIRLYKFKLYKQWNYNEYSKKYFREAERAEFREWCKKNKVLDYEEF